MGARVIDAAFRELDEQPGLSAADEAAIRGALAPDRDAAGEWVTEQLFTVIDGALPYVLGRDASFAVSVGFDDQPQLADPMGAFLDRNPERLLDEGYGYTDADLDALAASFGADGAARVQDELDQRLSIFREDFVWTEADLLADLRETQAESGESGELLITQLRRNVATTRSASWGALLAVIALAAAVGLLGGRRWPTRLIWASTPLAIAAGLWWVISGPVFRAVALPRLRSALTEASSDWSPSLAPLAPDFVSKVELLASDFVGGFESRALVLLAAAGLLLACGVAWALLSPGSSQDDRDSGAGDEPPMMQTAPVDSERAA